MLFLIFCNSLSSPLTSFTCPAGLKKGSCLKSELALSKGFWKEAKGHMLLKVVMVIYSYICLYREKYFFYNLSSVRCVCVHTCTCGCLQIQMYMYMYSICIIYVHVHTHIYTHMQHGKSLHNTTNNWRQSANYLAYTCQLKRLFTSSLFQT